MLGGQSPVCEALEIRLPLGDCTIGKATPAMWRHKEQRLCASSG